MPSHATVLYVTDPRQKLALHNHRSVALSRSAVRVESVTLVVPPSRFASLFLFGLAGWLPVVAGFVLSANLA